MCPSSPFSMLHISALSYDWFEVIGISQQRWGLFLSGKGEPGSHRFMQVPWVHIACLAAPLTGCQDSWLSFLFCCDWLKEFGQDTHMCTHTHMHTLHSGLSSRVTFWLYLCSSPWPCMCISVTSQSLLSDLGSHLSRECRLWSLLCSEPGFLHAALWHVLPGPQFPCVRWRGNYQTCL